MTLLSIVTLNPLQQLLLLLGQLLAIQIYRIHLSCPRLNLRGKFINQFRMLLSDDAADRTGLLQVDIFEMDLGLRGCFLHHLK
jgi:hypothetical protein